MRNVSMYLGKLGPRSKDFTSNPSEKDLLLDVLRRLERLEEHCKIDPDSAGHDGASRSMSVSSDLSGTRPASIDLLHGSQPRTPNTQPVVNSMLNGIKDDQARSLLSSNVFCHLRNIESRLFANEACVKAMEAAMAEVERLESTRKVDVLNPPVITKEMAKRWVESYYDIYQFEGFRVPLKKSFVMSIPDLLEIPHVQLDSTSRIIYYNILLQGILLDPEYLPGRGKIIQYLYQSCMMLVDDWLCHIRNTLPDMFAAFVMLSMTLEGCNSEMAWKIFGYGCDIARALGFFSVDEQSDGHDSQPELHSTREINFPDPTITGIDDASTRYIQIHFLASMRLTLTLLKYLDLVDAEMPQDTDVYDQVLDGLIAEVQTIMSDWNAEELVSTATNHVDAWFSVDILFSSYKMLIVFTQSKRCNQNSQSLPRHTVDVARKSLRIFQSLMSAELHAYWGISLILLHQFIPFFILCADIIGSHRYDELEDDFVLVSWLNDFVDKAAEERSELRPIAAIAKAMTIACQQVKFPAS
ncbi:fungal specific transcription factor [Aspergillus nomiae NRRL 13137]|uniref:Fungal specific transcription factor n=1 Tax=Aspergillus nomiae NRRL (strain ATCC 15546 / NRRL 13137 / CBS 260.88 / M93) TaxID=1509407 RepID=A0A0L1J922_ASPN3|nr:fungal specific transcription factor [Aspergillus nomiae NRRL 13137]KNG87913.1 fungal specific transcription factor [Aspergillus nomiae NRRL 13137]